MRPRANDAQKQVVGRRFARNAASARRRSGFSQDEAAERAGLHRTQISLLERGLRLPKLDTIVRLGGAVEAGPCELLDGLAWDLDRNRLWGPEKPGTLELKVGLRWEEV